MTVSVFGQGPGKLARLEKLAAALEDLSARIGAESADYATAVAIRSRFGASISDIQSTRLAVSGQIARKRDGADVEALVRLHNALAGLVETLACPLPETTVVSISRPSARRARQRAEQLDLRTRDVLAGVGKVLAAGAVVAGLYAAPVAAAGCSEVGGAATCEADVSGGVSYTSGVSALTVQNLTNAITPANGVPGVKLTTTAGGGGGGAPWSDGDAGGNAAGLSLIVSDPDDLIVTNGAPGVIVQSQAGSGGGGGGAGAGGSAGDGGQGGAGGTVSADIGIDIATSGGNAHGIVALSAGGRGGNGGNFAVGFGSAGDGGQGGRGGDVSVTFGGGHGIVTTGLRADGVFASSVGGSGGNAGSCDVAICGDSGGGNSAIGGTVHVISQSGALIETFGDFSKGVRASSIGGFGGNGGDSYFSAGYASNGASAGDGGRVIVENVGTIRTHGIGGDAIFAQSIGGGGGDGGNSGASLVSLGGNGSQGGNGGSVEVTNSAGGLIETDGLAARGIYAQSVGGGGGSGGNAFSLIAIGGNASGASNGGGVSVTNNGRVVTRGAGSQAIYAQSIGGGGGDGGTAGGLAAVGGTAGGGGAGGQVSVSNTGSLETTGAGSTGIFAQSIGGGGGDGGSTGGMISIGGEGGDGGDASTVTVANSGSILTRGDRANGIFAQSIGGGGGNGGGAASVGAFINVSVGGKGGKGGDGKAVTIDTTGASDIRTEGEQSAAVFAQSVGGGGGNGGYGAGGAVGAFGAVSIGVGGSAGDGGDAGAVEVRSAGYLQTQGADSQGVFAQSVGGGGGTGGFAVAVALAGGKAAVSGSVTVGGSGGKGGDGSTVLAISSADIVTSGDRSTAVFAQSIGGGGGNGGWTSAIAAAGGLVGGAITVSVGGSSGDGGDGKAVTVENSGDLLTRGADAYGILAQSVGGGGGNGGFAVSAAVGAGKVGLGGSVAVGGSGGKGGHADTVLVTTSGLILTEGDRAMGINAQSIGGGGGNGGWSGGLAVGAGNTGGALTVTVGGSSGEGGDASTVTVVSDSDIWTQGVDAHGLLAQSVGGGGGTGGFSVGAGIGAGQNGVGASVTVGGNGSKGGDAKVVTVTSNGDILTEGDRAFGVNAQSIGGGGGNGGWTGALGVGVGANVGAGLAVGVGGNGGTAGDGDDVFLTSTGLVETRGTDAVGLFAQSVGGGGGTGGFSIAAGVGGGGKNAIAATLSLGGKGGAGGDAGDVTLTSSGAVTTAGDRAYAIQAQSIGGGGGVGGAAASITAALGSGNSGALSLDLGGNGGGGGDAGDVILTSTGGAATSGIDAHAVFGQSVGGGGGAGGFTVSGDLTVGAKGITIGAGLGGRGGTGGDAGDVTVNTDGLTWTSGDGANGVFAQSVGGGGGDGGWAGSLGGSISNQQSLVLEANIGGWAGTAGDAGDVIVRSDGQILTEGADAHGILAHSVGGGGGTGGMALTASFGATKSTKLDLSLGGKGGAAGEAGDVTVTATDTINTRGAGSIGIFAQSVGGGGGAGGAAGAMSFSTSNSISLNLSVGGFGGTGSVGGEVLVDNSGTVYTQGELAHGILAQSIGGGGGHGGMAGIDEKGWSDYLAGGSAGVSFGTRNQDINISLGGNGGTGADGGAVTVRNSGAIQTDGDQANVVYAQSIGGGGGDAGVATAASGAFGTGQNGTYAIALGGQGNAAGNGDLVTVVNSGQLYSRGDGSAGIFAQSIGGGGGNGGDARGMSLSFSSKAGGATKKGVSFNISVGGFGGAAGDGGAVDITNSGQIVTEGGGSFGIFAQSVGGGGGNGGLVSTQGEEIVTVLDMINKGDAKGGQIAIGGNGATGGDGDQVTVRNSGIVYTQGLGSHAIFAQSIGGGGGNGGSGLAGEISIGGQGGTAGDGGDVTVNNSGVLVTEGVMARGIFAQSLGGGGGNGGATDYDGPDNYAYREELAATMGVAGNLLDTIQFAQSIQTPAFGIGIGGMGGSAGDGGKVTVLNSGGIQTSGVLSHGVFAQSVGGGGGTGGEGMITANGQLVFSGLGGNAGDGGDVSVTNTGVISTAGFGAYGILAQSVGGGGGLAGDYSLGLASWGDVSSFGGEDYSQYLKLTLNPVNGYGGDGGDVKVVNTGDIYVSGVGAVGIFAQSVGGGGGLFGGQLGLSFAGSMGGVGEGGTVTVVQNGNVIVDGKNGVGAFFQSVSAQGGQDIVATLNGQVRGGSVYGKGVLIDGGRDNVITLNGLTSAASGLAIVGTGGNDRIVANAGVIGNVDLGLGTNRFENSKDSIFESLDYIRLNGGLLQNAGVLSAGGVGKVQTTNLAGDYTQTASGIFVADLDLLRTGKTGEIDQLNVTGSLDLKGRFVLNPLNVGYVLPGDHTVTIIDGNGGLVASGLQLDAPTSAVAKFQLKTTAQDLALNYGIDFSPIGLNGNQTALGDHVNAIQTAGSSPAFAPIAEELFYIPSLEGLALVYDSLSPETYGAQSAAISLASQQFSDGMFSCPKTAGGYTASDRGCIWVKPAARFLDLSADSGNLAYSEQATGLSGGFEAAVGQGPWRIGAALSAETVDGGVRYLSDAEGERYQAGLVVKRDGERLSLGLTVHGGASSLDTTRQVILPGGVRQATATQDLSYLAATLRVGYRFGSDRAYLKPIVEISHAAVKTDAFQERGAGAVNLVVPEQTEGFTRASAKLEVGTEFAAAGAVVRPYGRVGVSYSDADKALFAVAFEGAPAAATGGFKVNPGLDKTTFDSELGVAIVGDTVSARFGWSGQFGDRTDNQTFAFKFSKKF